VRSLRCVADLFVCVRQQPLHLGAISGATSPISLQYSIIFIVLYRHCGSRYLAAGRVNSAAIHRLRQDRPATKKGGPQAAFFVCRPTAWLRHALPSCFLPPRQTRRPRRRLPLTPPLPPTAADYAPTAEATLPPLPRCSCPARKSPPCPPISGSHNPAPGSPRRRSP